MCGAPAVVAAILDAGVQRRERGEDIPGRDRVRIVVAGAPPPSKTIERVQAELGWEFIQIYGLTETSPLLTINRARAEWDGLDGAEAARLLSRAGVPAVGVQIQTDSEGEVLARSNHVFAGYWEQPEETARALADGWFHTGDGGDISDDGYLVISDRKKDVIITGGENVSSIEVEDCLYQHPAVAEVAVVGVTHATLGQEVAAYVVEKVPDTLTEVDIRDWCSATLAGFKVPSQVVFVPDLPHNASGKVLKHLLGSDQASNDFVQE
jgi:acyl-CoA synthetase (AMP-forming)/AMP-acid ligase II